MNRLKWLVGVAMSIANGIALAGLIDLAWDDAGHFERRLDVAGGGFVELCGRLGAGARVPWEFEATAPTSFNIHFHEGKTVKFPARQDAIARASGTLAAVREQDYCWMWTNKGAEAVAIEVRLSRSR